MSLLLDLVRHADALPKTPAGSDFDRALSPLGRKQALLLAERLRERGIPDQVRCSPAQRTRQTLAPLGYDFTAAAEYPEQIYECEWEVLLDLVESLRPLAAHALVVAHNPGLTDLATFLVGADAPPMVTAAHLRILVPTRPARPLRGKSRLLETWSP